MVSPQDALLRSAENLAAHGDFAGAAWVAADAAAAALEAGDGERASAAHGLEARALRAAGNPAEAAVAAEHAAEHATSPAVEAASLAAAAAHHRAANAAPAAVDCAQRALGALRAAAVPRDAPDVGAVLNNLALAYRATGDTAVAEVLARAAASDGSHAPGRVVNLASVLLARGKAAEPHDVLTRALDDVAESPEDDADVEGLHAWLAEAEAAPEDEGSLPKDKSVADIRILPSAVRWALGEDDEDDLAAAVEPSTGPDSLPIVGHQRVPRSRDVVRDVIAEARAQRASGLPALQRDLSEGFVLDSDNLFTPFESFPTDLLTPYRAYQAYGMPKDTNTGRAIMPAS